MSEASTQTSFVDSQRSAASSVASSLSSGEIQSARQHISKPTESEVAELQKQRLKKEKIQQIIFLQKQQHEKRIKALEKLAQLERLHAEKLRNIMLNTQNDSISSLIYDSFFQGQHEDTKTNNDTTTFDLDQLEREIKEQEYKLLSDRNRLNTKNATKRQSCVNQHDLRSSMAHHGNFGKQRTAFIFRKAWNMHL